MTQLIRPSDRRPPQSYAEWLQADAEYHAAIRRRALQARLAAGAAVAALVLLAAWGIADMVHP